MQTDARYKPVEIRTVPMGQYALRVDDLSALICLRMAMPPRDVDKRSMLRSDELLIAAPRQFSGAARPNSWKRPNVSKADM
jgi:hypothetical protein